MRKKLLSLAAAISVLLTAAGCSSTGAVNGSKEDKLEIVATIFPEYDWVRAVLGDNTANADLTLLLDNGVDLHSYQPTADDILKISTCDLFIYVGGESDEWVDDALAEATNKDMVVIDLLDVLGDSIKEEELVEGMQEEEHDHGDEDHDDEDHDHDDGSEEEEHEHEEGETEYDEHVWLSLKNASVLVQNISEAVQNIDSENAAEYKANTETYIEKLNELDAKYSEVVTGAKSDTLVFGDRFPFRYLTDDYGLSYYAAFVGCSAETEASFETVTFLSQKVDELGLGAVMTIDSSDKKIAETVKENTKTKDQQILTLDSMQSTTSKDMENGKSYLSIMEENLSVLEAALN